MGVGDRMAFEERLTRKLAILSEAERCGSIVVSAGEDRPAATEALLVNGRSRHFYGEVHKQGTLLEGILVDPGEHHAILPCRAPAAAAFMVEHRSWWSNDPTLSWMLQQTEGMLGLGQQEWKWYRRTGGRSYYNAEWAAQIRPLADGVHLVVRGLQGGFFDQSNPVGFACFLRVAFGVQAALANAPAGPPLYEACPTSFGEIACELLCDDDAWPERAAPVDATEALRAAFGALAGGELTLGPPRPKRMKVVEACLPPAAAHEPILVVLGNAPTIGDPKVVVLTPTHGFVRYKDAHTVFAWPEISDARPEATDQHDVYLQSRRIGWIPIPGCDRASAVAEAFRSVAAAVAALAEVEEDDADEDEEAVDDGGDEEPVV